MPKKILQQIYAGAKIWKEQLIPGAV